MICRALPAFSCPPQKKIHTFLRGSLAVCLNPLRNSATRPLAWRWSSWSNFFLAMVSHGKKTSFDKSATFGGFLKWWVPQQPWLFLLKMTILGCFGGTTIWGNTHLEGFYCSFFSEGSFLSDATDQSMGCQWVTSQEPNMTAGGLRRWFLEVGGSHLVSTIKLNQTTNELRSSNVSSHIPKRSPEKCPKKPSLLQCGPQCLDVPIT